MIGQPDGNQPDGSHPGNQQTHNEKTTRNCQLSVKLTKVQIRDRHSQLHPATLRRSLFLNLRYQCVGRAPADPELNHRATLW